MLWLRFATSEPNKNKKPMGIIPMSMVSEMMDVKETTLSWYERKYFS